MTHTTPFPVARHLATFAALMMFAAVSMALSSPPDTHRDDAAESLAKAVAASGSFQSESDGGKESRVSTR